MQRFYNNRRDKQFVSQRAKKEHCSEQNGLSRDTFVAQMKRMANHPFDFIITFNIAGSLL